MRRADEEKFNLRIIGETGPQLVVSLRTVSQFSGSTSAGRVGLQWARGTITSQVSTTGEAFSGSPIVSGGKIIRGRIIAD